ncbi:MAG TPA: UTP--glucose-1-phosphate uridylyltransferase [Beutenbergiaceae bacterium]|nr:UTP--glucose-1-phosphate uridylyltransferase [Beutenbergiaceae bacterium]
MTLQQATDKMEQAGVHPRAIEVFAHYYRELESGATGLIPEDEVAPVVDVPHIDDQDVAQPDLQAAMSQTVVLKLNGGLGTSMGMDRAKSLLEVRPGHSFLDIIVGQIRHARSTYNAKLPLLLMNSFHTRDDSLAALAGYPDLEVDGLGLDFLQNQEPKLLVDDLSPVQWPDDPALEWCPPGHGDLYTALEVSGLLDKLLAAGYRYASMSNSDNLGASPDPRVAAWFAASGAPYAAEVCRRTPADVKGGHLVRRCSDGQLVLRDTAQIPEADLAAAQDMDTHPYFHTNNLWFDLRALRDTLTERAGVLGLALIRNRKTVDPSDPASPAVYQIETAAGSAVQVFHGARAIEVDRSRFRPVKTTDDLLVLRSDVYELGEDFILTQRAQQPLVELDSDYYKFIADFDQRIPHPPSLVGAQSLSVRGDWTFEAGVTVRGRVRIEGDEQPRIVAPGTELDDVVLDGAAVDGPSAP